MSFDELPPELQLMIFSYLTVPELCSNVVPVCKQWQKLAIDPSVWKRLEFVRLKQKGSTIRYILPKILQRCTSVHHLKFVGYHNFRWLTKITRCNSLRYLEFKGCRIRSYCLEQIVTHFPLIESFTIDACDIRNDFGYVFKEWKMLKTIAIINCKLVTEWHQDLLLSNIANYSKRLENFILIGPEVSDSSFLQFMEKRGPTLRKLEFCGCDLANPTYKSLLFCSVLKQLHINSPTNMFDFDLASLSTLKHLTSLTTYCSFVLSNDFSKIFQSVTYCKLTHLKIACCYKFDDSHIEILTKCCPNLEIFEVWYLPDVTDKGFETVIRNCRQLQFLVLDEMNISKRCLINIHSKLQKLNRIDVIDCPRISEYRRNCFIARSYFRLFEVNDIKERVMVFE